MIAYNIVVEFVRNLYIYNITWIRNYIKDFLQIQVMRFSQWFNLLEHLIYIYPGLQFVIILRAFDEF